MKAKIISANNKEKVEQEIENFLSDGIYEVHDISFSKSTFGYSVLIIYEYFGKEE